MKNRAKCRLCGSIIESCHPMDYVVCTCGEIELNGGDAMLSRAGDYANFMRVDDLGNEISVQFVGKESKEARDDAQSSTAPATSLPDLVMELERLLEYDEGFIEKGHNDTILRSELVSYMMITIKILKRLTDAR